MSDIPSPKIGVLADRTTSGIYTLRGAEGASLQEPCAIAEACEREWASDAHLTTYYPIGPEDKVPAGSPWTRINKVNSTVLSEMRAFGCDLVTEVLAFDFDTPNHVPWEDAEACMRWIESFAHAVQGDPIAGSCSCIYTTKHGARIIYCLDRPVPVEDAESHHRWLTEHLRSLGVLVDEKCSDWTRLFRLPKVLRDGIRSEMSPTFRIISDWSVRTPVDLLGRKESARAASVVAHATRYDRRHRPMREEAIDRRERMNDSGRRVQTDFFTWAKKVLAGKESFGPIFDGLPISEVGSRNSTMFRLVGQVCGTIIPRRDCDPEDIYALFLPSIEAMDQEDSPPGGWEEALWDMVNRLWGAEVSKKQAYYLKIQAERKTAEDKMLTLIQGMREWCDAPELGDVESQDGLLAATEFVRRRALLLLKREAYVLQANGWYSPLPKISDTVIPHIRTQGLDWLIPTKSLNPQTLQYTDKTYKKIIDDHATDMAEVEIRPMGKIFAKFENMGDSVLPPKVVISPFARNPNLSPEPSAEVDEWLQALFASEYEFMVEKYIPHALAFEDGTMPALSIKADPGVGKNMFVQGMLECLCNPIAATHEDITGGYQYGLLKSPFLWVDEGWPPARSGANDVADVLRQMVTGKAIPANTKYGHPMNVYVMPRIIMTANNDCMLDIFNRVRSTNVTDQEAIAVRLVHIEANNAARRWLEAKGGLRHTGKPGARWIAAGGAPSNFIIAKHFLWLHSRKKAPTGSRMLVDGNTDPRSLERMRLSTMQAQTIAESLVLRIERLESFFAMPSGFEYDPDTGELMVTIKAVEKACEDFSGAKSGRTDVRLRVKEVMEHLPSVCVTPEPVTLPGYQTHLYQINTGLLVRHANKIGQPCEKVKAMADKRAEATKYLASLT